jgi:Flp pilus assembly protein TadD
MSLHRHSSLESRKASKKLVPANSRAFVHFRTGRFESAIADYDIALRIKPKNAEALFGRGTARSKIGDSAGNADIDAATAVKADVASDMMQIGVG